MGIASIVLGVAAFLFMMGGVVATPGGVASPVVSALGALLSFGAPVLALAGIVTGGVAISRARRDGESSGVGVAGVVVNVVALIPGIIVAITCGLCSALCTAGQMMPRDGAAKQQWWMDGGTTMQPQPGQGSVGAPDGGTPDDPLGPPPPGQWAQQDGGAATAEPDGGAGAQAPSGSEQGKTVTKRSGGEGGR